MAINLDKHKNELLEAWRDVLDDKTDTDWALFSYEGQTNDLKVTGTGSGGIEELVEDLNSGKVMYAFVKVNDPKTSLPKCVLINWQGEGANTVRKGICANHLRDVERFFKGANLTLNARTEDEVDVQIVHDKLAKAGSSYSFKAPRGDSTGPKAPIGSNYKPINPLAEINSLERDQFWMRQEQEERDRVAQEAERREAERRRQEEEVRRRDAVEAERRDEVTKRRNSSIDEIKRAEVNAVEHERHNSIVEEVFSTEAKVNQSDLLRQQRNQEAQNLIAQRTIDARSIFERNTSAGQIKKTPEKPVRTSILKAQQQQQQKAVEEETAVQKVEVVQAKQTEESDDEGDQFATIKRSPKDVDAKKTGSVMSPTIEQQETLKVGLQENNLSNKTEPVQQITEQQFVDEVLYGDIVDSGIQARALYDYQAADDTEITFDPGDVITHIELVDEGWWQGLGPDGTYGLFPANYVEII